jgi:2-C-methyl-D-erythritol 2,4-cyclodiphosphate synthase
MRIGKGFDIHRLVAGRKLILGGVEIPFEKGLLGHSDADVLLHAICDAILGAGGCGDIGIHFPDTDPKYKGANSLNLLKATCAKIRELGFSIVNIDSTVFAEKPKLLSYREAMEKNIAEYAGIEVSDINVKATTFEGLGAIGNGEGIGAESVVLLEQTD